MKSFQLLASLALFFSSLLFFTPLLGQEDLFADTSALQITIVSDWESVLADRGDSVAYHKARLNYTSEGKPYSVRSTIRARGNFRRNPAVCTFPPLKVHIEKKERKGSMFKEHKNLKLVCHCREESAILQEYLIYKTFQLLSPASFQVRLAEITYVDLKGTRNPEKHYGFFIEDDKHMAKRLGGKKFEQTISTKDSVNQEQFKLILAFMYMIGNMDWDIPSRKNIKIITTSQSIQPMPVPYDFDWSAAVNASYTGISEDFDRRELKNICLSEEDWRPIADKFLEQEHNIRSLYKDFKRLSSDERTRVVQYYKSFFRILAKPDKIKKYLVKCDSEASNG